MGCNCKTVKKVEKFIKTTNGVKEVEKKGIKFWLGVLLENIGKIFDVIVLIILSIIICPLVCIMLILSYIFRGRLSLRLPNYMFNVYKQAEKEIREKEEREKNGEKLSN